ncbi:SIS domain-containing protein [Candidatus Peregrinibacteria bacterium]|nr:SIS domain-containing protein [Candidatus Peregrinibacteria bacterium]
MKGASYGLEKRFKAVCLNDNLSALMAVANDISYEEIFVEQLKNFVKEGDVVIGISGSGNSMNVVKALEYGLSVGAQTVAICGFNGGKIKEIADLVVHVAIDDMEVSEDLHLVILHCVKRVIMQALPYPPS